ARSRAAMVDILHEVTDSLKPDEMYHILARRVARALNISKCSMVLAKPGDHQGVVVAAYENPMLRNLQIELSKYPEIRKAVSTGRLVLVEDVATDPLYEEERRRWEREAIKVPNRRFLAEALTQELDRARRYNLALTILLADIDRFKSINDTRGHVAGDSVLRQVGELLRREARSVDIVARYGGEEFVIVMPETA